MDDQLRQLQLTQLEMLKLFDKICQEHGIAYSLYAGTLLGAVRHKGFIPWDDDLDVCMSRKNYDRFLKVWEETKHDGYLLQNKENSPAFSQSFSKIRKEHSTFLQSEKEAGCYHTGIFIDIFPLDRVPTRKKQYLRFCWYAISAVYQRICPEAVRTDTKVGFGRAFSIDASCKTPCIA